MTRPDVLTPIEAELHALVSDEPPSRVTRPSPGQDNTIAVVDDRWVVRVARTDDARSCHANEVAVLAALPTDVRAPRVRGSARHGIVYEHIAGERLTPQRWTAMSGQQRRRVAADLRSVLDALHALDVTVLPDDPELLDRAWVLDSIERCGERPPRAPLGFDLANLASRFADAWTAGDPQAVVVHVDLKPDNLIEHEGRASVIDFGGVCTGDPAVDYGVLHHHFGGSMLEAMDLADAPLAARARCYADLYHLRRCTRGWTRSPRVTSAR